MDKLADLLKVHVEFSQSHLLFPTLVEWLMAALLLAIAVVHGPELVAHWRSTPLGTRLAAWQVDKRRFFGSIVLSGIYFAAMEPVGRVYPNSGVGFLLCSIVYGFALSWLFGRDFTRRKWTLMGLSSVITPTLVWAVFATVFKITLP